jgi:glycosyltransferase involved in cell wall biosynthesis
VRHAPTLLVVAEDTPDRSAETANGSTMITANVMPLLARSMTVDLAYYADGRRELDDQVAGSCGRVAELPLRGARAGAAAALVRGLPRASWRRTSPAAVGALRSAAADADAIWVHGLHAFAAVCDAVRDTGIPVLAHEIDPWGEHLRRRAATRRGPRRWDDLLQARHVEALERRMFALAAAYSVVSPVDAAALAARLGGPVLTIPNGVQDAPPDGARPLAGVAAGTPTLGFLGSLNYPPNIDAVRRLVTGVLPAVTARVPAVQVHVAGRRAGPDVTALAGPRVHLHGTVERPHDFYRGVDVMVFPGAAGTGTKNTLAEALAAGAPVVAAAGAARGVPDDGQLVIADTDQDIAAAVAGLLADPARRAALGERARAWSAARHPGWDDTAAALAQALQLPAARTRGL